MIYLGSDHAGFRLKENIKSFLERKTFSYKDLSKKLDPKDDYPDKAKDVAKKIKKSDFGILICGTGMGMCITANKFKDIRAVTPKNVKEAKLAREHNNANILCLGGWNTKPKDAYAMTNTFIKTNFSRLERHKRRVNKISKLK